jgi:hypothetical protein
MILMGERGAKNRHDTVTKDPVDRTLITMDGSAHPLEHRVEDRLRALRILAGYQGKRARDVCEQHGHLLSFSREFGARGENFVRDELGSLWSHRLRARGQVVCDALTR